jgi:eukaryotic-like serine/threonine-protein kinase
MGTVYLARDLKHEREVAVKVLSPELGHLAGSKRFLQEIDVVAHLHHPHILALYDSGESDGVIYFVMPRVEGESLRDRLKREHQLPIEDAIQIARQVAGAMHYAHRRGVIHRDIKPANILLQDGQALLSDFGIALGIREASDERLTTVGVSLGTPAYMSPEQAAGDLKLDARSDVYSLGAVLYEMLAGEPPHTGSALTVIARAISDPVIPVRRLRDTVSPHVESALQKALAKLPADRFQSAAEFARALGDSSITGSDSYPSAAQGWRRLAAGKNWRYAALAAWAFAATAVAIASLRRDTSSERSVPVRRWSVLLPDSAPLAFVGSAPLGTGRPSLTISPDGNRLVYVARHGATTALYLREMDKVAASPLAGTSGAYHPIFSPDGRWVAFFTGTALKKIAIADGRIVTLAQIGEPLGASWTNDGRLLVAAREGMQPGWVPATGGRLQLVEPRPETWWRFPQVLPDGKWVLHSGNDGALYLSELASGKAFAITREGVTPRAATDESRLIFGRRPLYVSTGHIVYMSAADGALVAIPFDADGRRVLGPPMPVLEGIRQEAETGAGQFAITDDGTLVYASGNNAGISALVWVDARGRLDSLPFPRAEYGAFDLSRDGKRIVIRVVPPSGKGELRVLDLERGSQERMQTRGIPTFYPRWTADSRQIVYGEFASNGNEVGLVLRQAPSAIGRADTLARAAIATDVSPDGRQFAAVEWQGQIGISLVPMGNPSGDAVRIIPRHAGFASFSPDGKWLAYSDAVESEVYVYNIEQRRVEQQISIDGGEEPLWSGTGDRIVYRNRRRWMEARVTTRNGFSSARPRVMFEGQFLNVPGWSHAVSPDGRRQLLLLGPPEETTTQLMAIQNWFGELRRLAPPVTRD